MDVIVKLHMLLGVSVMDSYTVCEFTYPYHGNLYPDGSFLNLLAHHMGLSKLGNTLGKHFLLYQENVYNPPASCGVSYPYGPYGLLAGWW